MCLGSLFITHVFAFFSLWKERSHGSLRSMDTLLMLFVVSDDTERRSQRRCDSEPRQGRSHWVTFQEREDGFLAALSGRLHADKAGPVLRWNECARVPARGGRRSL